MPGTESSESNADEDAQTQLWDDEKVLMGKGRANKVYTFYDTYKSFRFTARCSVFSSG